MWCPTDLGIRLSEALFIAGVLTTIVDPFLKRRILREASKDIFYHLLGFDLPIELRDTLSDFLVENRFYRKDMEIEVQVDIQKDGFGKSCMVCPK
jgi:hypothetical protein